MMDMIIINRESMKDLVSLMPKSVKNAITIDKRSVVLFPEGTRVKYGEPAKFKAALTIIQKNNDFAEIYPVAVNTGKFWGKSSFIKYPGVAIIRFLPKISHELPYKNINESIEKLLDENTM
jgi:1-acyl-sn-glycerol-3-phosphate acyltransferase